MTVYLLQKIDNGYVHAVYDSYRKADLARQTEITPSDIKKWQIIDRVVK
jgi:acetyl-CoA carboxylase alpha subunit